MHISFHMFVLYRVDIQ